MAANILVGVVLIVVSVLDILIGLFVVGPRIPEDTRPKIILAIGVGSVVMLVLGVLFLTGVLGASTS